MEALDCLMERRSCKAYTGEKVPREVLEQILAAGMCAPTGKGMQSPYIVMVEDEATVEQLRRMNAEVLGANVDPFYGATQVAVIFGTRAENVPFYMEDAALVAGNMLNAATALGVGSCYIYRGKQMFESEEGQALKAKWGIPAECEGVVNVTLGYAAKDPVPSKPRKSDYVRWF